MGTGTVIVPTPAVLEFGTLLEAAVGRLVAAIGTCRAIGRYEWEVESRLQVIALSREVEALYELSRIDLCLLPPAACIARGCYETAVRTLWMLHPVDPFEREARLLAHMATEEDACQREAELLGEPSTEGKWLAEHAGFVRAFRTQLEAMLPAGVRRISKVPNVRAILCELGQEASYRFYIQMSQFTHGTRAATGVYRRNLGNAMILREYTTPRDWAQPLWSAWWSLREAGTRMLSTTEGDVTAFCDEAFEAKLQMACDKILTQG